VLKTCKLVQENKRILDYKLCHGRRVKSLQDVEEISLTWWERSWDW